MRRSLKWQLSIPIMLWTFLVLLIINLLTVWELRADHLKASEANRMNQIKMYAEQIDNQFSIHKQAVETYGRIISNIYSSNTDIRTNIDALTKIMIENHDPNVFGYWFAANSLYTGQGPFVAWYGVKNGKLMTYYEIADLDPSRVENQDNPNFVYYWGPQKSGKTTISEVYQDQTLQENIISISTPIYDNNHLLMGVAGLDIALDQLQNIMNRIELNMDGYTLLTTSNGNHAFTPSYPFVNDQENIIINSDADFQAIYANIRDTKELIQNVNFRGEPTYFFSTVLPYSQWKIVSIISEKDLIKGYYTTFKITIYLNILLLVLSFFINVWWINHKAVLPLNQLIRESNKTLQPNDDYSVLPKTNNEITQLVTVVNEMNNKLIQNLDLENKLKRISSLHTVGEMAASISHEIRNPLTTIRGFLQILRNKQEYQTDRVYFDTMIEEVTRANNIITEYLSLAQDKYSELTLQDLNGIIRTIHPLMQANANANNQSVLLQLEAIPLIYLDDKEIRQLLHNLIRNGLESMNEGGVLTIRTYTKNAYVVLSIQDQGTGIPPEIIKQLGTPFMTTKETGTGLGLPVCYNIAKRHNAVIQVDTSSEGTTFHIHFPIIKQSSSP
ncbi:hypothetical protein E0485_15970 [Paenibacillus albiflavus]|uniref:histidine kinase n=1 Tax=Paenibacillus albiflavus TaxID=2545760 RepID=A0A4R4EAD3_9BACL|nr:ATP-binding protein [Paenibacillus albiflavus]TCZ75870.1 hypothetical protein E0485_15970 [Paenibacillus albiflavus]